MGSKPTTRAALACTSARYARTSSPSHIAPTSTMSIIGALVLSNCTKLNMRVSVASGAENAPGGAGEVGDRCPLLDAQAARGEQARREARLDIPLRIANEPGPGEVKVELGGRGEDHPRGGLA